MPPIIGLNQRTDDLLRSGLYQRQQSKSTEEGHKSEQVGGGLSVYRDSLSDQLDHVDRGDRSVRVQNPCMRSVVVPNVHLVGQVPGLEHSRERERLVG